MSRRLKQKSLLGYFEPSSPTQPAASSSPKSPVQSKNKSPKRRRPPQARRRAVHSDSDPPSGDESGSTSSDVGGIAFEPEVVEVSSDEKDVEESPRRPATQRKLRKTRAESVERAPVTVSSDDEDEDEEAKIGVPPTWRDRRRDVKGKRKRAVLDSDSDGPSPRKSKLIKGVRPPTPDAEDEDLLEELDEESMSRMNCSYTPKNSLTAAQESSKVVSVLGTRSLHTYKTWRSSNVCLSFPRLSICSSLSVGRKRKEAVESSSSSSESEEEQLLPGARPHQEGMSDFSDDDDEGEGLSGFIEEDSNAAIELPTEFSMNTYQDLMHHFKIICQLFVHLAVQPREERRPFMEQSIKGMKCILFGFVPITNLG